MEVKVKVGKQEKTKAEALIVGVFEGSKRLGRDVSSLDKALGGAIREAVDSGDFKGKLNQTYLIPAMGKISTARVLLIGLGKEKEFTTDRLRQASGKSAVCFSGLGLASFTTTLHLVLKPLQDASQAVMEGALLGLYRFKKYKTNNEENGKMEIREITLLVNSVKETDQVSNGAFTGKVMAEAANFARDMVNEPSNRMTPSIMAKTAKLLAENFGFKCRVLDRDEMGRLGMGSILGVAQGSNEPPRFIILEYNGNKKEKPVVLVGKAITFDSGGISIKPAEKMEIMKSDMAGGAAVMGAFMAMAGLKLPVNVVGLIPATENMPSGTACKPGDVLKASNGKTIEIISTDAEGRLILADALVYAKRYEPKAVIDMATLTGACVVALGRHASGMLGTDEKLMTMIKEAGERSYERVWQLPLWEEYEELLKSDIADVKNSGAREAGTIAGGIFLKKFVDYPWVHIDIAGTGWDSKEGPYRPKGATGVGVRMLTEFLMGWK
ncbi:MAG: leucyl aminopeptidase [Deltaproteobacteria bacterium]